MWQRRDFLLVLLACALTPAGQARADERPVKIDAPTLKVGDTWTYDRTDGWKNQKEYTTVVVVTEVTDSGSSTEAKRSDNGQVSTILRNKNLNRMRIQTGNRTFVSDPEYPLYSFPLEVGKSWEQQPTFTRSYDDWRVVSKLKGQVLGWEKVTVPAGTFDAMKIVVTGTFDGSASAGGFASNRWSGQQSETVWYAPEVKNLVKSVYEDSNAMRSVSKVITELVAYKTGQ